jgi:hypothetical protein
MKKALGILLILVALAGIAFLYYRVGFIDDLQKEEPVFDLGKPFRMLGDEFPLFVLLLMGSIGAFLYSFKWFLARKPPKMPKLRKTGDPEADRRAKRRREIAMAANVRPSARMPGALLMNSYFIITCITVLMVALSANQVTASIGFISIVLAAQLLVGFLLMLFALVWEKSLFKLGSLIGILVHLLAAAGIAFTLVRHGKDLQL